MQIALQDISVQFPGTRALDGVSVDFSTDEVHGIIGENGAGKSTLVNVLGGSQQPTAGRICKDGKPIRIKSPRAALSQGIAHVSQEGSLVLSLTGAENILLGAEPQKGGIILAGRLVQTAKALVAKWFPKMDFDLDVPVSTLAMAERKVIEIVRALRHDVRLLILDEPTATLPAREKEQLWKIIRSLPERGVGVVLISHFLTEIKALSDVITVLRDGRKITTDKADTLSEAQMVDMMLRRGGGQSDQTGGTVPKSTGPVILQIEDWQVGRTHIDSFQISGGEIVGLIGLSGAGHIGFARSLHNPIGVRVRTLSICGESQKVGTVRDMLKAGIALIPDHRMENSLIGEWNVRETLAMVHTGHAARAGVLSIGREETETARVTKLLNIKAHSSSQQIRTLSGGNKQKASIGKWLYGGEGRYKLLIFIEPTEGVDIGAKAEIYAEMRRLAASGAAILIASSDLIEIETIADRVISFVNQEPAKELQRGQFSESAFISAMTGAGA